ncbi:MAG: hypothetical protein KC468_37530 [Myxococcales bacterium]|nr:hypothetical protein [Myxococcales bacterium]
MEDDDELSVPRLTDVLGALVSGVAHARSVADTEVMNIARTYRRHEYLRHLSVPRLRVNKVVLELPVLLERVIPAASARLNSPEHVATRAREALAEGAADIVRYIETTQHKMTHDVLERAQALLRRFETEALLEQFQEALLVRLRKLRSVLESQPPGGPALSDVFVRDEVGAIAERLLRDTFARILAEQAKEQYEREHPPDVDEDDEGAVAFGEEYEPESKWTKAQEEQVIDETLFADAISELVLIVRNTAENAAILRSTRPADFEVRVNTEAIKNAGTPGAVTRVRMVLTEEGLEWSTEQSSDGAARWKLMPE